MAIMHRPHSFPQSRTPRLAVGLAVIAAIGGIIASVMVLTGGSGTNQQTVQAPAPQVVPVDPAAAAPLIVAYIVSSQAAAEALGREIADAEAVDRSLGVQSPKSEVYVVSSTEEADALATQLYADADIGGRAIQVVVRRGA